MRIDLGFPFHKADVAIACATRTSSSRALTDIQPEEEAQAEVDDLTPAQRSRVVESRSLTPT